MNDEPPSRMLLLMRHGKAESSAPTDKERPLASKGVTQARAVGDYLRSQGICPTRVLVSSAQRTRDTWDALRPGLPDFDGDVSVHDEFYATGPAEVLEELHRLPADESVVLVIGHEPVMSSLASHLADEESSDSGATAQVRLGMPTGSVSVFSGRLGSWAELGEDSLSLHALLRG